MEAPEELFSGIGLLQGVAVVLSDGGGHHGRRVIMLSEILVRQLLDLALQGREGPDVLEQRRLEVDPDGLHRFLALSFALK